MNERLCEILNKCYEISTKSLADVFFEYAPHCDIFSIYWYPNGWSASEHLTWLVEGEKITSDNMVFAMAKLNAIATELGVL